MTSTDADLDTPRGADTWYDVLDVARDVDAKGIIVAYERAIALIEGKRLGGYALLDPRAVAAARKEIEHALFVLTDEERRRAYDRSIDGDDADGPTKPTTATTPPTTTSTPPTSTPPGQALRFLAPVDDTDSERVAVRRGGIAFATPKTDVDDVKALLNAAADEQARQRKAALVASSTVLPTAAMPGPWEPIRPEEPRASVGPQNARRIELHDTPTPTPTPPPGLFTLDGEVNGQTIRRLREARKMSLIELAELTKIRKPYLTAIEEQDVENLPSGVYLRGFLTQIARVLRVDKVKLAEGYLAFIARFGRR